MAELDDSNFSQKSFASLPENVYDVIDFEFITGGRSNSEVLYTTNDHQMYSSNTNCRLGQAFLCTYSAKGKRLCKSRVYLVDGNRCIKLKNSIAHSHAEDRLAYKKVLHCLNEMKRRCGQLESFLSTTRLTVRDIFNQVLLE